MAAVEAQNLLKNLAKLKSPLEKRNQNQYCLYHKDLVHDIEECFKLKIAIERLIERGYLAEFVHNNNHPRHDDRPIKQQPLDNINVVSGGMSGSEDSQLARKRHVRAS